MKRRNFLQLMGLASIGTLAACGSDTITLPGEDEDGGSDTKRVYRLSSRKSKCGACKIRHYHLFYLTEEAAANGRPHAHCKCRIVPHPVPRAWAEEVFQSTTTVDIRTLDT